jgi:hypothetical protein
VTDASNSGATYAAFLSLPTPAGRWSLASKAKAWEPSVMNNSPYLDLPLFPLADALKAGVKALCATNHSTFHRELRAMPDPADSSSYPLTLRQADKARADFAAISDDLDFIKSQFSRQPDRVWLSRMGLLGFGSVWALLAAVAFMLTR